MRVLVCGGRDYMDHKRVFQTLSCIEGVAVIIHGGALGADSWAAQWAYDYEVPCFRYPARWKVHGKAAGPIRNQQMLDEGKPDLVVAFPGGIGTADMVRRARAAGVEVREIKA